MPAASNEIHEREAPRVPAPQPPWWGRALRWVVYGMFWLVGRALFRVRVRRGERPESSQAKIYVGHHKSDLDGLLAMPTAYWSPHIGDEVARGGIVAGEHIFQPGFLAGYVVRNPRWLSFLLYPICVDKVMRAMGWYPIPQARKRYLLSHFLDILSVEGDLLLSEVFRDDPARHVPGAGPNARIRSVLGWPYRDPLFTMCGFSIFKPDLRHALTQRHKARVAANLAVFTAILNQGGALGISPHGFMSRDGRMGRIKSGLSQIIDSAEREVAVLPGNVTYDFMSTGRKTVFVATGRALYGVNAWSRERLEGEVRQAILAATTVTLGHLAAHVVREHAERGEHEIDEAAFRAEIQARAQRMARDGYAVDERLLRPGPFSRRWRRFLAYCRCRCLLQRRGSVLQFDPRQVVVDPTESERVSPWVYSLNELDALVEARSAEGRTSA